MKFYHSLRFRIVSSLLVYGFLLILLNSGITFYIVGSNLSRLTENLLTTEVDYFKYRYDADHTVPLPHSKYIKVYRGIDNLPQKFKDRAMALPEGIHRIHKKKSRPPLHIAVMKPKGSSIPYYMVFNVKAFLHDNDRLHPRQALLLTLLLLLFPGGVIGYFTSRILFKPMVQLMEKIKNLDPDNIPARLSDKRYPNEIGHLTATLEGAMQRIRKFIQREKEFTRDASHELRTPLTIIKGAMEIMEQQPEVETNPLLKKPLLRSIRSVRDMETTIETFLWLAREEPEESHVCRVVPVVNRIVDDNRHLIKNKKISLTVDAVYDKTVPVREEVLYIAVNNLVRNAFQYTTGGSVAITIDGTYLEVLDTGMGIAPEQLKSVTRAHVKGEKSRGFGLGLSIVSRLCRRFGWDLTMESDPDHGTCVRILW